VAIGVLGLLAPPDYLPEMLEVAHRAEEVQREVLREPVEIEQLRARRLGELEVRHVPP